jgi:hypothetical protein
MAVNLNYSREILKSFTAAESSDLLKKQPVFWGDETIEFHELVNND